MGKATYQGKPLRPSRYLCGVDVMGREIKGKITKLDARHNSFGKTVAVAHVDIGGDDGVKMLRINAVNEDSLVQLFGAQAQGWIGKSIVLYLDPDVEFMGRKVGGARIRTDKQETPPPRTEPDPKKSGKVVGQIMEVIGKARSLEELTSISEAIKKQVGKLTKTDIEIIRREYKARQDQLAAPPADPKAVDGPVDPITGEVEQVPAESPPADDLMELDFGGPEQ